VVKWIHQFGSKISLLNTYGATEATSISSACNLCEWSGGEEDVPIGTPLVGTELHILNKNLKSLPIGVSGDLYISGRGVSRGYLNLADLTREKFIVCPESGRLLYKTGDFAYRGENGACFVRGRSDSQIKRRGYRIELAEVQAHIESIHGVKKSLVRFSHSNNQPQLNAYIVASSTCKLESIRDNLRAKCPAYMMPDRLILLVDFPKLPNGKLDLNQLERIESNAPLDVDNQENFTDMEKQVAALWSQILGHSINSKDDSFFDRGGNSLLIVKLHHLINNHLNIVSQCNIQSNIQISISDLFRYHTCRAQAEMIESQIRKAAHSTNGSMTPLELLQQLSAGSIDLESAKKNMK
jgi:iturin family lipopeptide synthetase C